LGIPSAHVARLVNTPITVPVQGAKTVPLDITEEKLEQVFCRPCDAGRSTNGYSGVSEEECPMCDDGYYCSHPYDKNVPGTSGTEPCGTCDETSISEYTTGDINGHINPNNCLSWDATYGFSQPGQCGITWIIIAAILCPFITVCAATWYIRCKRAHPPSEKAATIEYHDHHHHGAAELELADSQEVFQPQQPRIEPYLEEKWSPRRNENPNGVVAI